jgi:hypothetical protein
MGAVILGALTLYLLLSIGVVKWAAGYARRNGRTVWRWGGLAALVMYLIPFWDWLPTVAVHRYYCSKEAGFWVHKSVEQWKEENPGVLEALPASNDQKGQFTGDRNNFVSTEFVNPRIKYVLKHNGPLPIHRWKLEGKLVDEKTGEVLARHLDFSTSQYRRRAGPSGWKVWLNDSGCSSLSHQDAGNISTMIQEIKGG